MSKKTNAEYKRDQRARRAAEAAAQGVKDRVLPVPAGIDKMLVELCDRHDFTDWRELVFTMIRVCHGGAHELAAIPKSNFVPTEKQLALCGAEPAQQCAICADLGDTCMECEGL